MTYIIAVDPGGTTGMALGRHHEDEFKVVDARQFAPFDFCCWAEVWLSTETGPVDEDIRVACERFTITERTLKVSRQYDALEQIGVLRFLCQRYGRTFEFQQPADVMRLFPDRWLKERGWYVPGQGHANDALRHLAYRAARLGLIRI